MKFKNKILVILAVFMFALFVGSTRSFADESTVYENLTVTLYDGSEFIITNQNILSFKNIAVFSCKYGSRFYSMQVLASNDGAFAISEYDGSSLEYSCVDENLKKVPYYIFSSVAQLNLSAAKTGINSATLGEPKVNSVGSTSSPYYLNNITYSSYDILTYNRSNDTFSTDVLLASTTGNGSFFTPAVPEPPPIVKPAFVTTVEELQTGKIDNLIIKANDFNNYEKITLSIAEVTRPITDDLQVIYHNKMKSYDLYSTATFNDFTHFVIESNKLNYTFGNDKEYVMYMTTGTTFSDTYGYLEPNDEILDVLYFTVGGMTSEEIMQDKQDVTNNLLEEQHETSKGIWGTLKEVVSYLNPLSDNFFVFKLIDLLIDALKALFIPSTEYFSNWFTDLNDSFADQFGILYYPISVVIDFLGKLDNVLQETAPIIKTPEFKLSFMGFSATLLPAIEYNFNDLLANATFANVHKFYLFFVNVIFTIGLIAFCSKVATEIFGGVDDSVNSYMDNTYEADMRRYVRYQNVKRSYHLNKNQNLRNMRRRR